MTKVIIIKDSICNMFNDIILKLIFQEDYNILTFSKDLKEAVLEAESIIRIQRNNAIKQELSIMVNYQIQRVISDLIWHKKYNESFWILKHNFNFDEEGELDD